MKSILRSIFFLVLFPSYFFAQDSLQLKLKKALNDTDKINVYLNFGDKNFRDKPDITLIELNKALEIAKRHSFEKDTILSRQYQLLLSKVYYSIGRTQAIGNDFKNAISTLEKGIIIVQKLNYKKGLASFYNTMALAKNYSGDFINSLEYYQRSIRINQELNDTTGLISNYINIGTLYKDRDELEKAKSYYEKALKIANPVKHYELLGSCYNNLGLIYTYDGYDIRVALKYFQLALPIKERLKSKMGLATTYGNIGNVYLTLGKPDSVKYWINKSIKLNEEANNSDGLASAYNKLSHLYESLNNLPEAEKYARVSLKYAEVGGPVNLKHAEKHLYDLLEKQKKFEDANMHLVRYIDLRDSLNNIEASKKIAEKEISFEFEKKEEILKAEQQKQKVIAEEESKRQKVIIIFVSLVVILMGIFSVILFNRFKLIKKQNLVIEEQKAEVETKQKEILDSINYAKRIQYALLASDTLLKKNLPDHFVLFKPKDVVSGDFYWATPTSDGFVYITADCTGHGVPGAFMSLLNISKLSQTINENKIVRPDLILNNVRNEIIQALNPDGKEEGSKDGMDAVLCKLDVKNMKLQYAAANNSFYIIRNGAFGKEVIVCKADKMPVGKYHDELKPFTHNEVALQKGDIIYTFTDGFGDQFGGSKGKKYKSKHLQELLLSNSHETMEVQKERIAAAFESWRGRLEQVDDICVIGVKV